MQEVYKNLYVGNDSDVWRAKANNWAIVSACKDGPHGHRSMVGYTSLGAPKGKEYFTAERGKHLALNLIDPDDPAFISDEAVNKALDFIDKHIREGKVLVHCNHGHSRGPSIAFLYLKKIGDLPQRYKDGFRIFKGIYDKYDPGLGMEFYTKKKYTELNKDKDA